MSLVRPLFDGPIDVIGDIHGELDALHDLLRVLGYVDGVHPERRLVFVGDLCDRGPDSPGVIAFVQRLVEADQAQCVLGNHELNLLRGDVKHGNHWFSRPDVPERDFTTSKRAADPASRAQILAFLGTLPIALERSDLRVVHAAWHAPAIEALRTFHDCQNAFDHFEAQMLAALHEINEAADAELLAYDVHDRDAQIPLLSRVAERDELLQNGNVVRLVTSGIERGARRAFWASGKWRMVDRVRWWNDYDALTPVIVGHYWRSASPLLSGNKPDLFDGAPKSAWVGARHNVYCVDFSVGGRYFERARDLPFTTRLGAVRWPERELVLDDGTHAILSGPTG